MKGGIGASGWVFLDLEGVYTPQPFGVAKNRDGIEWRRCSLQMQKKLL